MIAWELWNPPWAHMLYNQAHIHSFNLYPTRGEFGKVSSEMVSLQAHNNSPNSIRWRLGNKLSLGMVALLRGNLSYLNTWSLESIQRIAYVENNRATTGIGETSSNSITPNEDFCLCLDLPFRFLLFVFESKTWREGIKESAAPPYATLKESKKQHVWTTIREFAT